MKYKIKSMQNDAHLGEFIHETNDLNSFLVSKFGSNHTVNSIDSENGTRLVYSMDCPLYYLIIPQL